MVYETRTLKVRSNPKTDPFHPRVVSCLLILSLPFPRSLYPVPCENDRKTWGSVGVLRSSCSTFFAVTWFEEEVHLGWGYLDQAPFPLTHDILNLGFFTPQTLFLSYPKRLYCYPVTIFDVLFTCKRALLTINHASSWRILCAALLLLLNSFLGDPPRGECTFWCE